MGCRRVPSRALVAVVATSVMLASAVPPGSFAQPAGASGGGTALACDPTGLWRSTRGPMRLTATVPPPAGLTDALDAASAAAPPPDGVDAVVSGFYTLRDGVGRIEGRMTGDRIAISWFDPAADDGSVASGTGSWVVGAACDSLDGGFVPADGAAAETAWQARRLDIIGISPAIADAHPDVLRLADGLRALEALRARLDHAAFDVAALAATLPGEPMALRDAVAARIALAPYAGAMRGARGTLMAGAGSPVDRALLLAALLQAKGHAVRFARADVGAEAAARLVDAVAPPSPPPAPAGLVAAGEVAALGLDPGLVAAAADAMGDQWLALLDAAVADGRTAEAALAAVLPQDAPAVDDRAGLAELWRDHVWVQAEVDGAWVDLDPAGLGEGAGSPAVSATLPADLVHAVTFEVSLETHVAGALSATRVGGWSAPLPAIMDAGVPSFTIRTVAESDGSLVGAALPVERLPEALGAALDGYYGAAEVFVPMLLLSTGETQLGDPFAADGTVLPTDSNARLAGMVSAAVEGGFGGITGGLSGLIEDEPAPPPPVPTQLTAVWVDIGWSGPGEGGTERRFLMDRIGAAARGSGMVDAAALEAGAGDVGPLLSGSIDLIAAGGPLHPGLAMMQMSDAILANRATLEAIARARVGGVGYDLDALEELRRYPGELLALQQALQDLPARLGDAAALVQAGPRIVAADYRTRHGVDGSLVISRVFDLIAPGRMVAAVPGAGARGQRFRFGVAATALEAGFARRLSAETCPQCEIVAADAVSTLAAAAAQGIGLRLLRAETAGQELAGLALDDDLLSRLQAAVGQGAWVAVPERTPAGLAGAGWWRIDPATGAALGHLASGEGGSPLSEYNLIERRMTRAELIAAFSGMWFGYGGCAGNWGFNTNMSGPRFLLCLGCGLFGFFTSAALFMGLELQLISQKIMWGVSGSSCLIGANIE